MKQHQNTTQTQNRYYQQRKNRFCHSTRGIEIMAVDVEEDMDHHNYQVVKDINNEEDMKVQVIN